MTVFPVYTVRLVPLTANYFNQGQCLILLLLVLTYAATKASIYLECKVAVKLTTKLTLALLGWQQYLSTAHQIVLQLHLGAFQCHQTPPSTVPLDLVAMYRCLVRPHHFPQYCHVMRH